MSCTLAEDGNISMIAVNFWEVSKLLLFLFSSNYYIRDF